MLMRRPPPRCQAPGRHCSSALRQPRETRRTTSVRTRGKAGFLTRSAKPSLRLPITKAAAKVMVLSISCQIMPPSGVCSHHIARARGKSPHSRLSGSNRSVRYRTESPRTRMPIALPGDRTPPDRFQAVRGMKPRNCDYWMRKNSSIRVERLMPAPHVGFSQFGIGPDHRSLNIARIVSIAMNIRSERSSRLRKPSRL